MLCDMEISLVCGVRRARSVKCVFCGVESRLFIAIAIGDSRPCLSVSVSVSVQIGETAFQRVPIPLAIAIG